MPVATVRKETRELRHMLDKANNELANGGGAGSAVPNKSLAGGPTPRLEPTATGVAIHVAATWLPRRASRP